MENKEQGSERKTFTACFEKIREYITAKDAVNTLLLLCMFVFYTLTFFVPKFYGFTEKYVGLFFFVVLAALAAININPVRKIKENDKEFIALVLLVAVVAINILIVRSGFGCFFVVVNFALIWYLSSRMIFHKWQMYLFGALYTLMLIYWFAFVYTWMFADYTSFAMNTNTAATFTVFSAMCAFPFFDALYKKHRIAGLVITIALVKCFQISLYHRSRGAFTMLIAFFALRFLIPKGLWNRKWFYDLVCVLATFGSLAFVAFYIWLGTTGVNFKMPFFYKNIFSGREAIWLEFWQLFSKKPFTGIGTNVTITSFFEFNVHNAMYNILVIHGVIAFALVIFIMFCRWRECRARIEGSIVSFCAAAALFAVCFESFFDVDLIWTDYSLNVFFLLLVMNMKAGETDDAKG